MRRCSSSPGVLMIVQLLCKNTDLLLPYCENSAPVILLQDGIYSAKMLTDRYEEGVFYALQDDFLASGLPVPPKLVLISAAQWVDLCAAHCPVITFQ